MNNDQSSNPSQMHNIVLIGFMGCGKSTIGRELKKSLGYHFIDTDHVIEEQAGKSIPEIFEQDGEQAFRDMETEVLKEIIHQKSNHHIIATGGGMPMRPENQALLQKLGFVVWLSCKPEKILDRTARSSNRPLLNCDDPLAKISDLLKDRSPVYDSSSHMMIDTSELDFHEISCGILESARYHFGSMPAATLECHQ